MLRTVTQLGSFGVLVFGVVWVAPGLANKIVDNHATAIEQLVVNNREQRTTAIEIIDREREECARQMGLERIWMSEQLIRERESCEQQFRVIVERLERALKER
jgi:hypothetical protein